MKKIALTLLTLGICLTSLGQGEQGWDLFNNSDTHVSAQGIGYNGQWYYLNTIGKGVTIAGWPLYAGTHYSLQFLWVAPDGTPMSDTYYAVGICYTNKISSVVTISGVCGTVDPVTGWCSGTPTVKVFSPC